MQVSLKTPEQFINGLDSSSKDQITKLHTLISKYAKGEDIVVWEGRFWGGSDQTIIGYGKYNYTRSDKKKVEWFKVGLAKQKNYITIFVNAVVDRQYLTEKYKDKLGKVKVGKSSISFKDIDDLDMKKLETLLKESFQVMNQ